jgi:hypothetical protein
MPGNSPAARPKIDLDRLNLSGLFAQAVALRDCLRERREPGWTLPELEALAASARKAAVGVRKEIRRLWLPRKLYAGDLVGEGRKRRAVEAIYLIARTLRPKVTVRSGWSGYLRDLEAAVDMLQGVAPAPDQYVTLDQAAAMVHRSKRTLERYKRRKSDPLPDPDISGGGGRADEERIDAAAETAERLMIDAGRQVLGEAFTLRVNRKAVRFPGRLLDEKDRAKWNWLTDRLRDKGRGKMLLNSNTLTGRPRGKSGEKMLLNSNSGCS